MSHSILTCLSRKKVDLYLVVALHQINVVPKHIVEVVPTILGNSQYFTERRSCVGREEDDLDFFSVVIGGDAKSYIVIARFIRTELIIKVLYNNIQWQKRPKGSDK